MDTIFEWLKNQNIAYSDKKLIIQALVHSSYVNEHRSYAHDNECLESMGNTVLQLWTMKKLSLLEPELNKGQMTTLRAQLVYEEALVEYNRRLGLGEYLMFGIGEEKAGGRQWNSILADMFETLPGAVFLGRGTKVIDSILSAAVTSVISHPKNEETIDYKTKLQEYMQSDSRKAMRYETVNVSGSSSEPESKAIVILDDTSLGCGEGFSKERAGQMAVRDIFEKMVK